MFNTKVTIQPYGFIAALYAARKTLVFCEFYSKREPYILRGKLLQNSTDIVKTWYNIEKQDGEDNGCLQRNV